MSIKVGDVYAEMGLNDAGFHAGLSRAKNAAGGFGGFVQQTFATAAGFIAAQAFQALATGVQQAATAGIEINAVLEQNTVAFEVLTRDAGHTKEIISELYKYAATTPFEFPDIANAARSLETVGLAGEKVIKWVGDLAAANPQATIGEVASAIARLKSGSFGEAFERLREFGISRPMLEGAGLKFDKGGSYKGSVDDAMAAVEAIVADRYGGMADAQSKTFDGMKSTMADTFNMMMGTIMEPAFNKAKESMGQIIPVMGQIADAAKKGGMAEVWQTLVPPDLRAELDPILGWFTSLGTTVSTQLAPLGNAVKSLFDSIAAKVAPGAQALAPVFASVMATIKGILQEIIPTVTALVGYITAIFDFIAPVLMPILNAVVGAVAAVMNTIGALIRAILAVIRGDWSAAGQFFMEALQSLWGGIVGIFSGLAQAIGAILGGLWSGIVGVAQSIAGFFAGIWRSMVAVVVGIFTGFNNRIAAGIKWLYNHNTYFKAFADFVVAAFRRIQEFMGAVWAKVTGDFNKIKAAATAIWAGIVSGVTGAVGRVRSQVMAIVNAIKDPITRLAGQAMAWGKNLLQQFIDGIRSKLAALGSAVNEAAKKLAKVLGFHSPAEEGPGSDADTWAPNFVAMYAKGLHDSLPQLRAEAAAMAGILNPALAGGAAAGGQVVNHYHFDQITIQGRDLADAQGVDDFLAILRRKQRQATGVS